MTYPTPGGVPPYGDHRPGRQRQGVWLWIALVVAVVVIVVLSAVVLSQGRANETTASAPSSPPVSGRVQPLSPSASSPPAGPMTCGGFTASVDAGSKPGWRPTIGRRGLAYAVPPDWTVAPCGVRTGWTRPCPQGRCVVHELDTVSSVANPSCPDTNLAVAGVTGLDDPDIKSALDAEIGMVPIIYSGQNGRAPAVQLAPVREFRVGNRPAVQTVATVTDIVPTACTGRSAVHSIVVTTVPNAEGSIVFLISLRDGANAFPKPEVINQIVQTLRSPA